jgi:hypothetical protein
MLILFIRDDIQWNWRKLCRIQWTQVQLHASCSKKARLPGRYFSVHYIIRAETFTLSPNICHLHWLYHTESPLSDSSATNKDQNEMQSKVWKSVKDATSTNTILYKNSVRIRAVAKLSLHWSSIHNTTEVKYHSIDFNTNINPHI